MFSNGVIVLAARSSCAMIYAFDADLYTLIHFYVFGVFTSFTLSQTGMVRHWIKERPQGRRRRCSGWRRSIVIYIIGAITTAVVLVVVIVSKFRGRRVALDPDHQRCWSQSSTRSTGITLGCARRRVAAAEQPGDVGSEPRRPADRQVDAAAAEALGYVRSFRPAHLHAVDARRRRSSP